MPSKYEKCPKALHEQAYAIMAEHHKDLDIAKVSLDLIFAYAGENNAGEKLGPALKHGGYEAIAIVKIVPLLNRVMGRADAQILLDGDKWPDLHEDQQAAVMDHELQHLVVAKDVEGAVITDSYGRPKLKMRLHDRQFGWFDAIAQRHREASQEVVQAAQLYQQAGQYYFLLEGMPQVDAATAPPAIAAPKRKRGSGKRGMIK